MANRREKVEAVTDFIFFGSKITVDGFCSECTHEIKKTKNKKKPTHLLIGRKAITNLNRILTPCCHSVAKLCLSGSL